MNEFDTKRKGVGVMIVETGEEFNSIQSCADYLGVSASWLGRVVRGDSGLRTCHGYHVIRSDNNVNLFDYLKNLLLPHIPLYLLGVFLLSSPVRYSPHSIR